MPPGLSTAPLRRPCRAAVLRPVLAKDIELPRPYLWWHHMNNRAIRVGDWKLVAAGSKQAYGPWELYDLRADRSETKDLAAANPGKVRELAELWQKCEDQFQRDAGPRITDGK